MEDYLKSKGFTISKKQWTPLMTMVHAIRVREEHGDYPSSARDF